MLDKRFVSFIFLLLCSVLHTGAMAPPSATSNDCECSWSSWTSCSSACGGGKQTRSRTLQTDIIECRFVPCSGITEEKTCSLRVCAFDDLIPHDISALDWPDFVDCECTWTSWSSCSATCEGKQARSKTVPVNTPGCNNVMCTDIIAQRNCGPSCGLQEYVYPGLWAEAAPCICNENIRRPCCPLGKVLSASFLARMLFKEKCRGIVNNTESDLSLPSLSVSLSALSSCLLFAVILDFSYFEE